MLHRADLLSNSRQDKNAGNSGDLVKHTAYLALINEMRADDAWRDRLDVVEAHAGKGMYASTSSHLREFQDHELYPLSLLGAAQNSALDAAPQGLGRPAGLERAERPYAGSPALHAFELSRHRGGDLTLYDSDTVVRRIVLRVFEEPAHRGFRPRLHLVDSSHASEHQVLAALTGNEYSTSHVLHFDPFAFVLGKDDSEVRATYRALMCECNGRVAGDLLGAVSVFFTWGSNGTAALADLEGPGYSGGLRGGYGDLLSVIHPDQRIVVTWCWTYYFSMVLVVPERLRSRLLGALRKALAPVEPFLSRLTLG